MHTDTQKVLTISSSTEFCPSIGESDDPLVKLVEYQKLPVMIRKGYAGNDHILIERDPNSKKNATYIFWDPNDRDDDTQVSLRNESFDKFTTTTPSTLADARFRLSKLAEEVIKAYKNGTTFPGPSQVLRVNARSNQQNPFIRTQNKGVFDFATAITDEYCFDGKNIPK